MAAAESEAWDSNRTVRASKRVLEDARCERRCFSWNSNGSEAVFVFLFWISGDLRVFVFFCLAAEMRHEEVGMNSLFKWRSGEQADKRGGRLGAQVRLEEVAAYQRKAV